MNYKKPNHVERVQDCSYYMVTLTFQGRVKEWGWMLAATDNELIEYARAMGYGIDIRFLGRADMTATLPTLLN